MDVLIIIHTNIPPHKPNQLYFYTSKLDHVTASRSCIHSRLQSVWKRSAVNGLVKISATCSAPATCPTSKNLACTFSHMKCTSTYMCLVLAWNTGFDASATALMLSLHSWWGVETETPSSWHREWSQRRSVVAFSMELYIFSFCTTSRHNILFPGMPHN